MLLKYSFPRMLRAVASPRFPRALPRKTCSRRGLSWRLRSNRVERAVVVKSNEAGLRLPGPDGSLPTLEGERQYCPCRICRPVRRWPLILSHAAWGSPPRRHVCAPPCLRKLSTLQPLRSCARGQIARPRWCKRQGRILFPCAATRSPESQIYLHRARVIQHADLAAYEAVGHCSSGDQDVCGRCVHRAVCRSLSLEPYGIERTQVMRSRSSNCSRRL